MAIFNIYRTYNEYKLFQEKLSNVWYAANDRYKNVYRKI